VRLEGLGQLQNVHLIGTRSRDLPACSIVPQQTTLPRAPSIMLIAVNSEKFIAQSRSKCVPISCSASGFVGLIGFLQALSRSD
jgi:hypothetical protein